jgi:hypothetical protein
MSRLTSVIEIGLTDRDYARLERAMAAVSVARGENLASVHEFIHYLLFSSLAEIESEHDLEPLLPCETAEIVVDTRRQRSEVRFEPADDRRSLTG